MVQSKTIGSKLFDGAIILLLLLITLTSVFPIVNTLALSFSSPAKAMAGAVTFWPKDFNLNAYKAIFDDQQFFQAFFVSLKRVFYTVLSGFLVTLLIAFPLSRSAKEFFLRTPYTWLFIFVMMFNGGIIPFYLTIKSLGLMNSIWALVLPLIVNVYNVILVVNFFRNIPRELDESAAIDGAGPWTLLFRIYLPLSVPVLATITLFNIVNTWNEYFYGLIFIQQADLVPLQTYIQQMIVKIDPTTMTTSQIEAAAKLSNKTLNAAKIFVTMLPVLIIYPLLQRFFITGITLGSVKE